MFISLTSRTIFCFEINSFVFGFFVWIAFFIMKSYLSVALGAFACWILYFWITYLNDILDEAVSEPDLVFSYIKKIIIFRMSVCLTQ